MNISRWMTSCAPCLIPALTEVVNQNLRHDGTTGIPGAQHQNFDWTRHYLRHPPVDSDFFTAFRVSQNGGHETALEGDNTPVERHRRTRIGRIMPAIRELEAGARD